MATDFTTSLRLNNSWNYVNANDLGQSVDQTQWKYEKAATFGTGSSQQTKLWYDRRYVTPASPNDDIDLAGSLVDSHGTAFVLTKIKKLIIENLGVPATDLEGGTYVPTIGEDLVVGDAASNPIASIFDGDTDGKITVPSGGCLVLNAPLDGFTVSAGSADVLRITNSGTDDIVYLIIVEGY